MIDAADRQRGRGQARIWIPTWERIGGSGPPEASCDWFLPEVRPRYEALRWEIELDRAWAEGVEEDRMRDARRAEEQQQREVERLKLEKKAQDELAARRAKAEYDALEERARREAPKLVEDRLPRGLTLKGIAEPDRSRLVNEAFSDLMRRWEGDNGQE